MANKERPTIHWRALIVSFIGAAFVGPALGAGLGLVVTVVLAIALGEGTTGNSIVTRLAFAASAGFFLGTWWAFYRLTSRIFD